jgi:hypothetical protein
MCQGTKLTWRCKCSADPCPNSTDDFLGHRLSMEDTGAYFWCDQHFSSPSFQLGQVIPPCPNITYQTEERYRPNLCDACVASGCAQRQDPNGEMWLPSFSRGRIPLVERMAAKRQARIKKLDERVAAEVAREEERERARVLQREIQAEYVVQLQREREHEEIMKAVKKIVEQCEADEEANEKPALKRVEKSTNLFKMAADARESELAGGALKRVQKSINLAKMAAEAGHERKRSSSVSSVRSDDTVVPASPPDCDRAVWKEGEGWRPLTPESVPRGPREMPHWSRYSAFRPGSEDELEEVEITIPSRCHLASPPESADGKMKKTVRFAPN